MEANLWDDRSVLGISYPWAFGHLLIEPAVYLHELGLRRREPKPLTIHCGSPGFANPYFVDRYLRNLAKISLLDKPLEQIYRSARDARSFIDCSQYLANDRGVATAFEVFAAAQHLPPPFRLNDEDRATLRELLTIRFGHDLFPHITVSIRKSFGRPQDSRHTWRNSDFAGVLPALEQCYNRFKGEIFVILVGDNFYPRELPSWIWNYPASVHKSFRADVALLGSALFHFGTNSGINCLPTCFGRPNVLHNVFSYGTGAFLASDLVMYKSVYDTFRRRLLTLPEAVSAGFVSPFNMLNFSQGRYRIVDNSPEEITELMNLAIDVLEGKVRRETFKESNETFRNNLPHFRYNLGMAANISPFWLSRNLEGVKRPFIRSVSGQVTQSNQPSIEQPQGATSENPKARFTDIQSTKDKPVMAPLFPSLAPVYIEGRSKININAVKPVAVDSPDHIVPWGTARDNSTHSGFNAKLLHWIPKAYLSVLDIGCSGGGFVRSLVNEGVFAVGVEGSDYSKLKGRAEWGTIPDRLFTADATAPFQLDFAEVDESNFQPLQLSVITAWEMIEHVREEDLQAVFSNIDKHLVRNGVVIMSISPNDDFIEGVNLHQCVHERSWWIDKLRSLGWENQDFLGDFFEPDWIRSEPNAPGSFHVCLTRVGSEPLFQQRIDRNAFIFSKHGQPSGAISRLLAERFRFQSDPVVVCDAGVRGGFEGVWNGIEQYLHLVGIDVDADATVGLQPNESTSRRSLISRPVASAPGHATMYRTRNDVASSFLPPNWEYIKRFPQMVPGEIVGRDEMEFVAFRSELAAAGVSRIDYLKLDIEGFELEALKGLGSIRDSLLCVSVEVFFQPYRFGSPTYGMIEDYLRPLGFSLFDLLLERWKRQCVADPNNPHTWYGDRGQIMWGQAIFLRDPILSGEILDPSKAARLAFIADVLGFKDFSLELVTRYNLLRFA